MFKFKSLPIYIVLLILVSCRSSRVKSSADPAVTIYKITILYPNAEGKTFDMDYYEKTHMPLVAGMLGSNLRYYEIDKPVPPKTAAEKPPYLGMCHFYVSDLEAYTAAVTANREKIVGDFQNYTNVKPVVQVSEVRRVEG